MNTHTHQFTQPKLDPATWEPRYRAAVGTADEPAVFAQLAAEMEAEGDDMWLDFDLLVSYGPIESREEALGYIEEAFAAPKAVEAFDDACYTYEVRAGQPWDGSPSLFDSKAWIERRAAEIAAATLDKGQRAFVRGGL